MTSQVVVAALYKFVALPDYDTLREPLLDFCQSRSIRGTLLLAREGINGTIAGSRSDIDAVLAYLKSDVRMHDLEHKESFDDHMPFHRMKVKLKKEIVTMGIPDFYPNDCVGTYVKPQDWKALIDDPDVLLIDTRNDNECDIGSSRGAVEHRITNFGAFPA